MKRYVYSFVGFIGFISLNENRGQGSGVSLSASRIGDISPIHVI